MEQNPYALLNSKCSRDLCERAISPNFKAMMNELMNRGPREMSMWLCRRVVVDTTEAKFAYVPLL